MNESETRFRRMTTRYRTLVDLTTHRLDAEHQLTTCAVDGWPMQANFIQDVFTLERPGWKAVPVKDKNEANAYRPCLYIRFELVGMQMTADAATIY